MKHIFLTYLLFINAIFYAQNLVPNPSFEEFSECPQWSQLDLATGWVNPTDYSPDYFNACANESTPNLGVPNNGYGIQNARTGLAYAGIYIPVTSGNSLREYIQTKLTEPLYAGVEYKVKFYVSLAENHSDYSVNSLGIYFSDIPVTSNDNLVLNVFPQVTNNSMENPLINVIDWQEISGSYTAIGGEEFITIGNFQNDSSVDTTSLVTSPSIYDNSYYYIDDVSVEINTSSVNKQSKDFFFTVYPNPASDIIYIDIKNKEYYDLKIFNLLGSIVLQCDLLKTQEISVKDFPVGIYLLQLSNRNTTIKTKKVVINH